jgi:membrane-bound ClpP family serine protease
MGKIRVKTIGVEEDEKDQKKKAKEKAEAKRIEAAKKAGQEAKAAEQTLDEATELKNQNLILQNT